MEYLFFFLSFFLFVFGLISMAIPHKMMFWTKWNYHKKEARKKTGVVYFGSSFLFFILFVIALPKDELEAKEVKVPKAIVVPEKSKEIKKAVGFKINRNDLIKKIQAMDKTAHFEIGADVNGETNYFAKDENNNLIQIVGPENKVSFTTWIYFSTEDAQENQLSLMRLLAFANILTNSNGSEWVGGLFKEISGGVKEEFERSKKFENVALSLKFSPIFNSITLTAKPILNE